MPVLALALAPSFASLDVMFVGTAVAFNTVVKFADAFLDVLAPDVGQRVFMTAIAGVTAVIVASMASRTGNVVVAIKRKVLVVVKACRRPLLLRVTLKAIASIFWCSPSCGFLWQDWHWSRDSFASKPWLKLPCRW